MPGRAAALVLALLALPRRAAAGCAALGLCCPGRDPSCLGTGWRPDGSYGPCYCDQACEHTLDCCHDYARACPGECGPRCPAARPLSRCPAPGTAQVRVWGR